MSVAVFVETMERIADQLKSSVVVSRTGPKESLIDNIIQKLNLHPPISNSEVEFPIPLGFARTIARLRPESQVEFVKRWKDDGISVNARNLEEFIASVKINGFELAYDTVYMEQRRSFATEQALLGLMAIDPVTVNELVMHGYNKTDVQHSLEEMRKSGMVKQQGSKFELTDTAAEIYGKVWNSLPDTALATWLSRSLTAMGALRLDSDKAKFKRIIGYIQKHLDSYKEDLDKPASLAMVKALGQQRPSRGKRK